MNIVCIITARGGSKRIPRKNIKDFLGKPLLAWSIEVAKKSDVLDRIIVSTEDDEIARVAKNYGAEVPFIRPLELAQDTTLTLPVIQHAVEWLRKNESYMTDWVVLLEPPSPGRQAFHIREVVKILREKNSEIDSINGVSEIPGHFSPLRAFKSDEKNMLTRYPDGELIRNLINRNQDLPKLYFNNSSIYAFKAENLTKDPPSLWGDKVLGYLMDIKYAMDIDTPEEWLDAEIKMKRLLTQIL